MPLFDYPNHLARMHILADGGHSANLRQFYQILWQPLPNLAMDLIVPPLAQIMPLALAGKLFLLMISLLTAGGAVALHRSLFHRWSVWPCLAFLLLYNRLLLWGFVNFLFGVGLALIGMALWVGVKRRMIRLACAALFAILTYFAHLSAFGAFAILALGYELGRLRAAGRLFSTAGIAELAIAALPFLPPIAILLANATGAAGAGEIAFSPFLRKFDLFFNVFDNYSRVFDVACFVLLLAAFAIGLSRRAVRLSPAMTAPLLLLLLAQLAMPNHMFGGFGADHRLPLVLALVLIASSDGLRGARQGLIAASLGALFLCRIGIITLVWLDDDRAYRPVVAALRGLPEGSRIAIAYPPESVNIPSRGIPMTHLGSLAVIERDAFVPTLFTYAGQQPLRLQPRFAALAAAASPDDFWQVFAEGAASQTDRVRQAMSAYDYILFVASRPFDMRDTAELRPVRLFPAAKLFQLAP